MSISKSGLDSGKIVDMILEDLEHRYEALQPRIALVRSYL